MLRRSINTLSSRKELHQAKLLFWLFVVTLGVFFLGGLLTYVFVRTQNGVNLEHPVSVPSVFWWSTILLVLVSIFLQRSSTHIHREQLDRSIRHLVYALMCASAFVFVQWLGLEQLLEMHAAIKTHSAKSHGVFFFLAVLHAIHVFAGMIYLAYVMIQSFRNKYDHERHWAIDHCAGYWHFLDVVWITMLLTFWMVG